MTSRSRIAVLTLVAALASLPDALPRARAEGPPPAPPHRDEMLPHTPVRVSEHVWALIGFPNVAIVVGATATLVVDTGLGRDNGAVAAGVAQSLAPGNRLVVTTTHFHPEHAAGILGFPPGTRLVRDRVQQDEMEAHGEEMVRMFAGRTPFWNALLTGEQLRAPDELFDDERTLDLGGGVSARLLWFGPAHTKGDELVFVAPDRTLVSGDVVQNKVGPYVFGEGGSPATWLAAVDAAARLAPLHVVPDHSAIGDGSLVAAERAFLVALDERAAASKAEGLSADEAGMRLTKEFRTKYPDWTISDLTGVVRGLWSP